MIGCTRHWSWFFSQQKLRFESMKNFKRSMIAVLAMGLVLFGCQPENVDPSGSKGGKSVAGAFDASHTAMDSICLSTSPVFFRNTAGSFDVDKCIGAGGVLVTCNGPQQKWGSLVMYSGYTGLNLPVPAPEHWLDVDFSLTTGWMCDFTNWAFVVNNGITIDQNTGLPDMTGTDWKAQSVNPARNQWKIAIPVDSLAPGSFDMACRMTVLRLKLNGAPNEPTRTTLWMINENYANTSSPFASNNEYALRFTPANCIAPPPPVCPNVITNTVCEAVYKGITCSGNTMDTKTLTADSTGAGAAATYLWSNGATTRSISVSPATTTAYTVTVKKGACDIRTTSYNVNVIDVACLLTVNSSSQVTQAVSFGSFNGGQRITNQLSAQGVSSVTANGGINQAWIFNSAAPTGGDTDLGTPNQAFGGPGIGAGGSTSNNTALGKLIIIQENSGAPDDNGSGGSLNFNFASPRKVTSIKLVDFDGTGSTIRLTRSNGSVVTIPIPATGDNGVVTMTLNTTNVTQLRVRMNGSGAVAGFTTETTVCGGSTQVPGVRVCDVPPGCPNGASTVCVESDDLHMYIDGVCGSSTSGKPGSYLGACGSKPCQ